MTVIGVISDTHGLLRPEAVAALIGSDLIIHAGDVGSLDVLAALRNLAPVKAVQGNVDTGEWANDLPILERFTVEKVDFAVHHGHLPTVPAFAGARVRIQGHSHIPRLEWSDGKLLLNPGSAGARRFGRPVAVALVTVDGSEVEAELVDLTER